MNRSTARREIESTRFPTDQRRCVASIAHHGAKADIRRGLDLTSVSFDYRSDTESFTLSATSAQFGDTFFVIAKDATGIDRFHVGNQKATFLAHFS